MEVSQHTVRFGGDDRAGLDHLAVLPVCGCFSSAETKDDGGDSALSSPILIKVHFEVIMTMIADTLYSRLAQQLRGFEECDAPKNPRGQEKI
jgi:hypothetical protein